MRIFVTGATGVIGRRVVPLLLAAGHRVTAVARSAQKKAALEELGAHAIELDLFAPDAVRRAVAGHNAVINLATHIPIGPRMFLPGAWHQNDRLRRVASATLSDAALAAGADRFLQESFAPIYADRGDHWIDENWRVQVTKHDRSVRDAEASTERFARTGRIGVILRFGPFYGADAEQVLEMIRILRRGWAPLPGPEDAYISPISHDDAATAVVAALGARSGIYNVVDDKPVRHRDYVNLLAAAMDLPPPRLPPAWVAKLAGSIGETLARSLRISNAKLEKECAWAPRYPSVREGWRAVAQILRASEKTAA